MTEQEKLAQVALGVMTWEDFQKESETKLTYANGFKRGYHKGYQAGLDKAGNLFDEVYGKKEEEECDCCEPDCPICQAKKEQMDQDYDEMMDLQIAQ